MGGGVAARAPVAAPGGSVGVSLISRLCVPVHDQRDQLHASPSPTFPSAAMFSRSLVASLAALVLANAASAQSCARTYTVKAGDICDSISAAQNVSTYQLATVNPDIDTRCDDLTPGEQLCLGYVGSDCTTTHVVTADESCDGLAALYTMNTTVLMDNNPQIDADCANMYTGEVLCVATGALTVPSATAAASSAAASATDTGDDDDGDIPFCDEL
ncbi:uncharacterized protein B0H18DRAFT_1055133 [Fomitopsis serialis]|uniref:uncharacterized protein n=1 Tax=Fomitopsis serialis TaxID=139415 RepID=UPI0020079D84|nr:uncharacterized protein B0H18DRAFT_1055133 [Neoantrodia serialis]KAH9912227.1 hypothetical protein B0H18DRAFT_1055133 [Neoantrodia serialis]